MIREAVFSISNPALEALVELTRNMAESFNRRGTLAREAAKERSGGDDRGDA